MLGGFQRRRHRGADVCEYESKSFFVSHGEVNGVGGVVYYDDVDRLYVEVSIPWDISPSIIGREKVLGVEWVVGPPGQMARSSVFGVRRSRAIVENDTLGGDHCEFRDEDFGVFASREAWTLEAPCFGVPLGWC